MGGEKMKLTPDSPEYQDLYREAWIKQLKFDHAINPKLKSDLGQRAAWDGGKQSGNKGGRPKTDFKKLPDKAKIINNMKLKNITDQEIATMTGILLRTVRDYVKRYDLPRKD